MPHITISLYPGQSEQSKKELAQAVKNALLAHTGAPETAVSVRIREVPAQQWKERVYIPEISASSARELYIPPGYEME